MTLQSNETQTATTTKAPLVCNCNHVFKTSCYKKKTNQNKDKGSEGERQGELLVMMLTHRDKNISSK